MDISKIKNLTIAVCRETPEAEVMSFAETEVDFEGPPIVEADAGFCFEAVGRLTRLMLLPTLSSSTRGMPVSGTAI